MPHDGKPWGKSIVTGSLKFGALSQIYDDVQYASI